MKRIIAFFMLQAGIVFTGTALADMERQSLFTCYDTQRYYVQVDLVEGNPLTVEGVIKNAFNNELGAFVAEVDDAEIRTDGTYSLTLENGMFQGAAIEHPGLEFLNDEVALRSIRTEHDLRGNLDTIIEFDDGTHINLLWQRNCSYSENYLELLQAAR